MRSVLVSGRRTSRNPPKIVPLQLTRFRRRTLNSLDRGEFTRETAFSCSAASRRNGHGLSSGTPCVSLDQCVPAATFGGLQSVNFPRTASGGATLLPRCGNEKSPDHCTALDAFKPCGSCFLAGPLPCSSCVRASGRQLAV